MIKQEYLDKVREFLESDKRVLFIQGDQGSGKTYLIENGIIPEFNESEIIGFHYNDVLSPFGLSSYKNKKVAFCTDCNYKQFCKYLKAYLFEDILLGKKLEIRARQKSAEIWDFSKTKFIFSIQTNNHNAWNFLPLATRRISNFLHLEGKYNANQH